MTTECHSPDRRENPFLFFEKPLECARGDKTKKIGMIAGIASEINSE
jgi:hypothetical protein